MSDDAAEFAKKLGGPMNYDLYPFNLGSEAAAKPDEPLDLQEVFAGYPYACYSSSSTETAPDMQLGNVTFTMPVSLVAYEERDGWAYCTYEGGSVSAYCVAEPPKWPARTEQLEADDFRAAQQAPWLVESLLPPLSLLIDNASEWLAAWSASMGRLGLKVDRNLSVSESDPIDYFAITRDVSA